MMSRTALDAVLVISLLELVPESSKLVTANVLDGGSLLTTEDSGIALDLDPDLEWLRVILCCVLD